MKPIPTFKTSDEERDFWAIHDSTEYLSWKDAVINPLTPDLKPSTKTITLRISESLLANLKQMANRQDVPYQSLLKTYLSERVDKELNR